jgi:formate-dependent nitrite reductase membrane component NrfD
MDNGFGIGLLFLGIFGIINIHNENQLAHGFKRKALLKNLAIFVVGVGLILSGYTGLFAQIKLPIF